MIFENSLTIKFDEKTLTPFYNCEINIPSELIQNIEHGFDKEGAVKFLGNKLYESLKKELKNVR